MTNEEAIKYAEAKKFLLESCIYQDDYAAYGNYAVYHRELEFVNAILSALRSDDHFPDPAKMVPLTLEQLRVMDGQPGYWQEDQSWGIISVDSIGMWAGIPFFRGRKQKVNFEYDIESRGMEIYAYPPVHIDMDAWTAEWKEYTGSDAGFHYCSKCKQQAFNYEDGGEITEVLSLFCPSCGRPMTPEAVDELKKRLKGENAT